MNQIRIDVISQNYIGLLEIEATFKDLSLFTVYINETILGHAKPMKNMGEIKWYSYQIRDKELLGQIGDWIEYLYPLKINKRFPHHGKH